MSWGNRGRGGCKAWERKPEPPEGWQAGNELRAGRAPADAQECGVNPADDVVRDTADNTAARVQAVTVAVNTNHIFTHDPCLVAFPARTCYGVALSFLTAASRPRCERYRCGKSRYRYDLHIQWALRCSFFPFFFSFFLTLVNFFITTCNSSLSLVLM